MILIGRIVAKDIHVEPGAFLDHGQANPSGADNRDRLSCDFVPQKRQVGMPVAPLVFPRQMLRSPQFSCQSAHHEEREFRGGFSQHVCGMSEGNLVPVGIGAIDVVESNCNLRHHSQFPFSCFEHFGVDRIAQGGNQTVNSRLHFLQHEALRRRLRFRIHFHLVATFPQPVKRVADVARSKHSKFLGHDGLVNISDSSLTKTQDGPRASDHSTLRPSVSRVRARRDLLLLNCLTA